MENLKPREVSRLPWISCPVCRKAETGCSFDPQPFPAHTLPPSLRLLHNRSPISSCLREQWGLSPRLWRRALAAAYLLFPQVSRGSFLPGVCLPEQYHAADQGAPPGREGVGDRLVPKKMPAGLYCLQSLLSLITLLCVPLLLEAMKK